MSKYGALILTAIFVVTIMGCKNKVDGSLSNIKPEGNIVSVENRFAYMLMGEESPYIKKLDEYIEAINNHVDLQTANELELFAGVQHDWVNTGNVSYSLLDMNGDGANELILFPTPRQETPYGYDSNYIYAAYTINDNMIKAITTQSFGPRDDGYYLYDNGIMKQKLGGTGITKIIYYRLNDRGELDFIEEIDRLVPPAEEVTIEWYQCLNEVDLGYWPPDDNRTGNQYFERISESEAEAIQRKYEKEYHSILKTTLTDYYFSKTVTD